MRKHNLGEGKAAMWSRLTPSTVEGTAVGPSDASTEHRPGRAGAGVRWLPALLSVLGCGLALMFGIRDIEWVRRLPLGPLTIQAAILAGGLAAALVTNRQRPLRRDGTRQVAIILVAFVLSLASPVMLFALAGVTAPVTKTSNSLAYTVLVLGQLGVYVATTAWFAWHRRWLPTAAMIVALIPLVQLEVLAGFAAACSFFHECI